MTREHVDPVTFEVIWGRLLDITEEMGINYMRTSGSPVLVEGYDAGTAITLPDGQIVALGPYITTQGTVLSVIIDSVIKACSNNPGIRDGDMFMCNDPYLGATHQNDVATVAPVFDNGKLVAWTGCSGHWVDIGGSEPGSLNMKARSIYEEGFRMPPLRLVENNQIREDIVSTIMHQIRDPLAEFDLRGQIVANITGRERLDQLFKEYGTDTVVKVMHQAIDYVERRLRKRLSELPDGVWRQVQYLDNDGHSPTIYKLVCTVEKQGDHLNIDFTGTDPQAPGFVNCTWSGLRAATLAAVFILLAYDLPWNEGVARCIDLKVPEGVVLNAQHPAPVALSTTSSIVIALSLVYSALNRMLLASPEYHEEAAANWAGTSVAPVIVGKNDRGFMTVHNESSHFAMGGGARSYRDGVDTAGFVVNTTAGIPSIEISEAEYPQLYLFRRQLQDSGGPGRFRGGVSAGVALVPYDTGGPLESVFSGTGAAVPNAYGLAGGMPGAAVRYIRFKGTSVPKALKGEGNLPKDLDEIDGIMEIPPIKHPRSPFPEDMVEYHNWQGGGGFGDPLERLPEQVRADVSAGLVSQQAAREVYGVVLEGLEVDEAATEQLRSRMRQERLQRARPALEVIPPLEQEIGASVIERFRNKSYRGVLRYGDLVVFDFDRRVTSCGKCNHVLVEDAPADYLAGCVVEKAPLQRAGRARGEDYGDGEVFLRLYYCPNCARQLEAEVAVEGGPRWGFLVVPCQ